MGEKSRLEINRKEVVLRRKQILKNASTHVCRLFADCDSSVDTEPCLELSQGEVKLPVCRHESLEQR